MKKIFTLLILLMLLPVTALAADMNTVYVGGVELAGSSTSIVYATTNESGEVITNGADANNYNIKWDGSTLTLKNAYITNAAHGDSYLHPVEGAAIGVANSSGDAELTIQLESTNTIEDVSTGIFVFAHSSSTSDATLTITGDGNLTASGSVNAGILVQSNDGNATLSIKNAEVTTTSSSYCGVQVRAKDSSNASLTVNGGSLTATGKSEDGAGIRYTFGGAISGSGVPSLNVSGNAIVKASSDTGGITSNSSPVTPSGTGIVFNNGTGTVYGSVTLQEDLTIGEDESLTLDSGASLDAGDYDVIVDGGTLDENLANSLGNNVKYAPAITNHPQNVEVKENETATFTIVVTGTEPLSYQWQQSTDKGSSWMDITGETNASYTIATTTTYMNDTQYRCVVSNSAGSVESHAATLTVNAKPTYTITAVSSPAEGGTATADKTTAAAGETITLTATPSSGYYFVEWKVVSGTVSIQNNKFTMPAENVEVQAVFGLSVTNITLDKTELSLYTGDSETLTATIEPGDATNKTVTWSSDKPGVAAVDASGKVTAKAAGKATITAMADGGKTATCVVKVRKPATVEASGSTNLSFTTDQDEFTLTATVQVNGDFLNPTDGSWTWNVADADVVALSGSPTWRSQSYSISRQAFTVEGTGTTTITATYDDGTYRGSVDFTVRISKPTPPDPISYYNIYVEDVCDGVEVTTSKQVVREGGSVSVYVEKDTVNYTFDNFKVYYKRSYYGGWEELKEGTQPGEYPIKNIWTHIYIKAEGAEEKEDPTGIESIEGVKVYTKDGSLYVQTPQREQVIIVSMSGAVVKNEEQVGLKQYHGLQPGIYIVRVGDRAYKLRLN